ncbi:mandelate racemase/muconate lactonizing enzyme family protein [Inquilinus sp. CAU 1745]|uniref:mandelate racemase/muconate lactonizing enzyme family protein n=1 Tax=Inquilinus sp. CAU 1745 TaxID=3140369 RepID=UPI00325BCDB7
MVITGIETIRLEEFSNLVWVRLHTDEGLIGLGETFRNPEAITTYVHETCAPFLLGKDPMCRGALSQSIAQDIGNHFSGFPTRSVEVRGNSAVDIALWDLWGQALNAPIHALLGGKMRDRIRIYNTCANSAYNNRVRQDYNSQIYTREQRPAGEIGRHEDLLLQVHEPARLAQELLDEGITAMKIWPFDIHALRNRGETISSAELKEALWPIEQIRSAVGDAMEIMIEYHGLWRLPAALIIAKALEDHSIYWHEDPIALDNFEDLSRYKDRVSARVAASENLGTVPWYRETFRRGAVDVANFDMAWVGGLSEGVRVANLAHAFDRTIAPHDCTGPVTLLANVHLLASAPNSLITETVRSHIAGFYREVMTDLPIVEDGYIHPTTKPGLGAALNEDVLARGDLQRRVTGRCAD